jgi:hypothetical protein
MTRLWVRWTWRRSGSSGKMGCGQSTKSSAGDSDQEDGGGKAGGHHQNGKASIHPVRTAEVTPASPADDTHNEASPPSSKKVESNGDPVVTPATPPPEVITPDSPTNRFPTDPDGPQIQPATSIQAKKSPGSMYAQPSATKSQVDFFRMLDEKVEKGPDYTPPLGAT